jgi:hypothetical protein
MFWSTHGSDLTSDWNNAFLVGQLCDGIGWYKPLLLF